MNHAILAVLFWVSGLLLLYIYVGYPALCWMRAKLRPKPWRSAADFRPSVSIVVAAYNEANNIRARIANLVAERPSFPLEILIGSDGSADGTYAAALQAAHEVAGAGIEVQVFDFPRGGKIATLALLLEKASGEVIVFTDANCEFAPGALAAVVARLADPSVGCAGGVKRIGSGHADTAGGERSYWDFENRLKNWESAFGSCAGADGALYAIRRRDLPQLVTNRLLADDLYLSLAACREGRRCVLVPEAVVLESSDTSTGNELRRKARILAGALPAIAQNRRLLVPRSGLSLPLWSHKVLRWFSFLPIIGLLVGALGLPSGIAGLFYLGVGACCAAVLAGFFFPSSLRTKAVKLPYYFALMNLGQVLGLMEWILGDNGPAWEKVR